MAIKISGTTVIDDSRQLQNIKEYIQVISANTTAQSSYTYVITDTLTLLLPAGPAVGDFVKVSNRSGNTDCVISRNGSNIMSLAENMTIDLEDAGFTLTYSDSTRGWVII